jgi:hypothetical protein
MDIVTLKISITCEKLLTVKINDDLQLNKKCYQIEIIDLYEIFDTSKFINIWKKICSQYVYIYVRYNCSNISLCIRYCNIGINLIPNKMLIPNIKLDKDETSIILNNNDINYDLHIIINIFMNSNYFSVPKFKINYIGSRDDIIIKDYNYYPIITRNITRFIFLKNPNRFFKLLNITDYDKKITSIKLPLYKYSNKLTELTKITKSEYEAVFDLYPSQGQYYYLNLVKLINNLTNNSYNIIYDKECMECRNRIQNCELNMISKIFLCCECNKKIIYKDINTFIGKKNNFAICSNDFPSYVHNFTRSLNYLFVN